MFQAGFIIPRVQESLGLPAILFSTVLSITSSGIECNLMLRMVLGLRIVGASSFTHFFFKTCFKAKHWEMQTTNTFAQSCNHVFPPKGIVLDHCNVLGMQER